MCKNKLGVNTFIKACALVVIFSLDFAFVIFLVLFYNIVCLNYLNILCVGELPKTRQEKEILRRMIRECPGLEGTIPTILEENFEEAIHFVNTCISTPSISSHVQNILEDDSCTNLTQNTAPFWVMCAALREHVLTEGCLPVPGSLPDMATDTASFVTLQQIYHKHAQIQAEAIYRRACQIARNLGLPHEAITENEVSYINHIRYFSVKKERLYTLNIILSFSI